MKLSVFPSAKAHPSSKDEKRLESFKVSAPYLPETREFFSDEDLLQLVTSFAWSPFVFSGKRHADNFVSTDTLVYDIDEGLTLEQAQAIVEKANLACLCLPSPSHTDSAHRFRIIMPLAKPISCPEIYEATWNSGAEIFPSCDKQTCDVARFYFGCTATDGFWNEGALFEPSAPVTKLERTLPSAKGEKMLPVTGDVSEMVLAIFGEKRTVVSESVDYFLRNAHTGLSGNWNTSLNSFCFSLAMSNVEEEAILEACEQLAPNVLDAKDIYQIKRSIRDARKHK